jgi:hypothetical protein
MEKPAPPSGGGSEGSAPAGTGPESLAPGDAPAAGGQGEAPPPGGATAPAGPGPGPAPSGQDTAGAAAQGLAADWGATLFRPFPTAGDLDRLTAAVAAALRAASDDANTRAAGVVSAVDEIARQFHADWHAGLFSECLHDPCPALREVARRAQSA